MSAYYNEFDPKTAAWLRQLIKNGDIAEGEVDERSITDVRAEDLRGFTQHKSQDGEHRERKTARDLSADRKTTKEGWNIWGKLKQLLDKSLINLK